MRPLAPFALFLLGASAVAQMPRVVTDLKPSRTLQDAMLSELADPKVQVAIRVTSTQRDLQELRIAATTMDSALDLMRTAAKEAGEDGVATFTTTFATKPAKALYPFLAENQIAKLRRLTLADQPLSALATDEVAFALTLSAAQRKAIEALYVREAKAVIDPRRPSTKAMYAAFKDVAAASARLSAKEDEGGMTVEKIDAVRPVFARLFRALERASRLRAGEAPIAHGDPLKLLSAVQRRRYRDLGEGTPVAVARPSRVAKRP